jgi:hypothetical protein
MGEVTRGSKTDREPLADIGGRGVDNFFEGLLETALSLLVRE